MKQGILIAVMVATANFSCRNSGTEPPSSDFQLIAEDVGVTEVWLRVKVVQDFEKHDLTLTRDGQTIFSLSQTSALDTVFFDDSLSPNRTYTYSGTLSGRTFPSTLKTYLSVKTMDTTSRNFTWQTFAPGGGGDSYLRGVAIIDENDIWASGEISVRDSAGQIVHPSYGAARWDGNTYELKRPTVYDGYRTYLTPSSVIGFAPNEIWFVGGGVHLYDGNVIKRSYWISPFPGNPNPLLDSGQVAIKVWGEVGSSLYVVGLGGALAHFDGSSWRKLNSGTTTAINDVFGIINSSTHKEEIYCAVSDIFQLKDRRILKVVDDRVDSIAWDASRDVVLSVWTNQGIPLYVGGGFGMYENKTGSSWKKINLGTDVYPSSIRGTGLNNIVAVGSYGLLAHYNGVDWKILGSDFDVGYNAVAVKGNTVAAVGSKNGRAILTIGKRH